jgi:bis(5'-nucleosidyl)-tetraphosphatase
VAAKRTLVKNLWESREARRASVPWCFANLMDATRLASRVAHSERSAGVVVYRAGPPREFLLLHYPSGHWDFPKGHVEAGESDLQAALREVHEETGIRAPEVHPGFEHQFVYHYRRGRGTVRKTVVYFVGRTEARRVAISHEHRGFAWLPFEQARDRITYKNAKELLEKAEKFLTERSA